MDEIAFIGNRDYMIWMSEKKKGYCFLSDNFVVCFELVYFVFACFVFACFAFVCFAFVAVAARSSGKG